MWRGLVTKQRVLNRISFFLLKLQLGGRTENNQAGIKCRNWHFNSNDGIVARDYILRTRSRLVIH